MMGRRPIYRATLAGFAYFCIVFAVGFVLGALRVLILIPRLGETAAILLELPILLTLSWMVCGWLTAHFDIPTAFSARLVMGALAFAVLMLAELGGSTIGFGRSLSEHLEQYRRIPALLGLAGQIAFAVFPVIQSTISTSRDAQRSGRRPR